MLNVCSSEFIVIVVVPLQFSKFNLRKDNNIGVSGAKYMSEFLKESSLITSLNMTCVLFMGELRIFGSQDNWFFYFGVSGNNIETLGICQIADALKINASLTSLEIWSDTSSIIDIILKVGLLMCMNVIECNFDGEGVKAIVDALKSNDTLTSLNIGCLWVKNK